MFVDYSSTPSCGLEAWSCKVSECRGLSQDLIRGLRSGLDPDGTRFRCEGAELLLSILGESTESH